MNIKDIPTIPLTEKGKLNKDRKGVDYVFRNELFTGSACFSNIFYSFTSPQKGEILEINLFPKSNTYNVKWKNLLKYIEHLNKLYSNIYIQPSFKLPFNNANSKNEEIKHLNEIWLQVMFTKKYNNIVLRDMTTRIRFLFENPFNVFMDELLDNPDFKLSDIEECMSNLEIQYYGTGHYLHKSLNDILLDYTNYEKRFISACKGRIDLHNVMDKLVNEKNNQIEK